VLGSPVNGDTVESGLARDVELETQCLRRTQPPPNASDDSEAKNAGRKANRKDLQDDSHVCPRMLCINDRGERPPPTGTVERERRFGMADTGRAEKRSGGWLDRFC